MSAAHLYGKKRVSAEALTSLKLTFDEDFNEWKVNIDRHFARGVTHIVFHTYTHNPVVNGKPPSTSFGGGIGSPFLRGQTWWPYLRNFTDYLAFCGHELERGRPVVDILRYLGDDVNHRPTESVEPFDNRYKVDYLNNDALMTVDLKALGYKVIWIPSGTFVLPETERRLAEVSAQGIRVFRGDFTPDWLSPLALIGESPEFWYQRRDGDEDIFFCADAKGRSKFVYVKNGERRDAYLAQGAAEVRTKGLTRESLALKPREDYPAWATHRVYEGIVSRGAGTAVLDLGEVRSWATIFVNDRKVADLWCRPYCVDLTNALTDAVNYVRVEVVSTWYNRLVYDAGRPASERKTWTIRGPAANAPYRPSGLLTSVYIWR